MEISENSRQKELESAQEENTMGIPEISKTKDFSSEKQIANSIQMEESTNPRANWSSQEINSPEIAYGGQMLHEEYALLSSQTEPGQQMSYTALIQQVIQSQSPKINLHTNQNSMILTTNRCHDEYEQMIVGAEQENDAKNQQRSNRAREQKQQKNRELESSKKTKKK
uniref:Uncharacterized protein n=1 Tax=Oryza punctata TaxID=4537 RepID=A0A0E0KSP3_ORYPU